MVDDDHLRPSSIRPRHRAVLGVSHTKDLAPRGHLRTRGEGRPRSAEGCDRSAASGSPAQPDERAGLPVAGTGS